MRSSAHDLKAKHTGAHLVRLEDLDRDLVLVRFSFTAG